jgi:hypothetical protein
MDAWMDGSMDRWIGEIPVPEMKGCLYPQSKERKNKNVWF